MKTGCVSCDCKALDEIWPAENVGASVTERALGEQRGGWEGAIISKMDRTSSPKTDGHSSVCVLTHRWALESTASRSTVEASHVVPALFWRYLRVPSHSEGPERVIRHRDNRDFSMLGN